MTIPVEPEAENKVSISRELISILLLLLGSILIIIGSFMTWGLSVGILVIGVLIFIVAVAIGWQR